VAAIQVIQPRVASCSLTKVHSLLMPTEKNAKPQNRGNLLLAVTVFVAAGAAVWWLWANRFFLSLDEGIYLAGAERILRGQVPYRDFFVITGPGSFWIQAAILGLLGSTLRHARLSLVFDMALLTALVYWLTARLGGRNVALVVAAAFFAFETRPLFRLYVNHRWDSSAFALLAVALVFAGTESPRLLSILAGGITAATAAWITPSLLAVLVLLGVWLLMVKELRRHCIPYLLGIISISLFATAVLFFQGALGPMFGDLLWTSRHYPAANAVPYGYGAIAPGGLRSILAGAQISASVARATGFLSVLLPVVLPLAVYGGWMVRRLRRRPIDQCEKLATLLMLASFGLVISTYPRWSADQLLFIAPIFYVLAGYLLSRVLTGRILRVATAGLVLGLAIASLSYSVLRVLSEPVIETRVGRLHAENSGQSIIKLASSRVRPGDSLFVYPYLPIVYFLTGGRNPTPYSFLQPGMMQAPEYETTLLALRAHPPQWIFYFGFSLANYHGIWPAADPQALNLTTVDHYILSHYHPVGILQGTGTHFFLLERGAR
jgi:hypothetical protein